MYFELLVLGLICLAAPCFARFAGHETRRKPFDLVGIGGIFFLLAASFGLGLTMFDSIRNSASLLSLGRGLMGISFILGWLSLIVGAVWSTLEIIREPEHGMLYKADVPRSEVRSTGLGT